MRCASWRSSTGCTASSPPSSGCRGGACGRSPCITAPAATGRPNTGCGTACSEGWRTHSPSAGCSAGRCATGCGRSCPDARRLGAADRPGAGRRAEPARARGAVTPSGDVPALRRSARESPRDAGRVRPLGGGPPCPHRAPPPHPRARARDLGRARPRGGGGRGVAGAPAGGGAGREPPPGDACAARGAGDRRSRPRPRPPPLPLAPGGAGPPPGPGRPPLWVEITVGRQFAAGETRASEEVTIVDSAVAFDAQAVIPPRRVTVRMSLVRGDTASSLRAVDFVPEAPARRVRFVLGGETFDFDVTLERPEPPRTGRDSALAVDADVVCLRLRVPGSSTPARVRCGRLDNVARRLALIEGDTLVATFAWPAVR